MKRKLLLTTGIGLALSTSSFAMQGLTQTTWTNVTTYATWSTINNKMTWKEFKEKLHELKDQLKNAQSDEEKQEIKEEIYQLFSNFEKNHKWVLPAYVHNTFHYVENEELKSIKEESEKFWWNMREENKELWSKIIDLRKNIIENSDNLTRKNIHKLDKYYKIQFEELREKIKATKDESVKNEIRKQIRNLRIEKLTKIKFLVKDEYKKDIDTIISMLQVHWQDHDLKRNNFINKKTEEKDIAYKNISDKLKSKIDAIVNNFVEKLKSMPTDKADKLLYIVKKRLWKIIENHYKNTKNPDSIHFKTEIAILNYLQDKINEIKLVGTLSSNR